MFRILCSTGVSADLKQKLLRSLGYVQPWFLINLFCSSVDVYRKWNERLFHEMYNAYRSGRAEKDPAEFW